MTEEYSRFHDFFEGEGFLPVDEKSYPIIKTYGRYSILQEMSAVIMVIWNYNYYGLYKIIEGYFCSVYFYEGREIYWNIHRPEEAAGNACSLGHIIDILFDLCEKAGLPFFQVKLIEERFLDDFKNIESYEIDVRCFNENDEYAYKIEDLINLSGTVNYYKRKRVKKFFEMTNVSIRPMTNENMKLCFEIEEEWCKHQDCGFCISFTGCEKKAMEAMALIFDDRIHTGLFLYQDETPAGYIICEKISEKLAFLYLGKANVPDGFVYLIYIMFRDHIKAGYMNIHEDMGHPGLRRFKTLLAPHELWRKYIVTYLKKGGQIR
ncbi:hypothetical protein AGMMS4952_02720 [Spirochaetia bacterium]|nr:hypothetical protein AGMMS4952_02720 [Spirochaetia bacterium]